MVDKKVLIVGGGLGGAKTAEALRAGGYPGTITLVGAENHLPYERPPLSKDYLAGSVDRDSLAVHDHQWYVDHDVTLRLGVPATQLDLGKHEVELGDGSRLEYGELVLATGSRARHLNITGSDADGVVYLRDVDDSDALATFLGEAKSVVVIGAGWIGLEVAANARARDVEVHIVETARLPLLRVLGPELAQMFADLHRQHGVVFHFEADLVSIEVQNGRAAGVTLGDGATLTADLVVIGVGAQPNVEIAIEAGLDVDNGILVDQYLRTSDPSVYAVGDIAAQDHPRLGRLRVEHWATALNQPAAVAATINGDATPYTDAPYFFTDQFDLGMEYRGFIPVGTEPTLVVRGDLAERELIAFWLSPDDVVLAAMNVNVWDAEDHITRLLEGAPVDPRRLADLNTPLDQVQRT